MAVRFGIAGLADRAALAAPAVLAVGIARGGSIAGIVTASGLPAAPAPEASATAGSGAEVATHSETGTPAGAVDADAAAAGVLGGVTEVLLGCVA